VMNEMQKEHKQSVLYALIPRPVQICAGVVCMRRCSVHELQGCRAAELTIAPRIDLAISIVHT
jgi:hypothetical protein